MRVGGYQEGLISEQNSRFILHDSKGFEQGEDDTLGVVTQFIKERRNNEDIKEQLHAVWCADSTKAIKILLTNNLIGCVSKYPMPMLDNA